MKIYMVSLLHRATIKEEGRRTNHSIKIYMVSLLHRATINYDEQEVVHRLSNELYMKCVRYL